MNHTKFEITIEYYKDGEPCNHKGCINHITHPCENCGRKGARGEYMNKLTPEELGKMMYDEYNKEQRNTILKKIKKINDTE